MFDFHKMAKTAVASYYNDKLEIILNHECIYEVWFCKTLQNWKAILSTSVGDRRIFEFTWNGNANEGYLDVYKKEANEKVVEIKETKDDAEKIEEAVQATKELADAVATLVTNNWHKYSKKTKAIIAEAVAGNKKR